MPRPLRIETNDGVYHVINRGNYRGFIFGDDGAREAFERCLFEACERFGWELMAYCLMENHFHLCIATPKGNLSEGMRWLQGTFAARFNRFRQEKGHLFQGRFKSLLVEPGIHLSALIDYIHLNPVRAGLAEDDAPAKYRWSSLYWFPQIRKRPDFMDTRWMDYKDSLSDNAKGWKLYLMLLQTHVELDPKELDALETKMCRGWCIGDKEFKRINAKEFLSVKDTLRLEKEGLVDLNQSHWENLLNVFLDVLKKTAEDIKNDRYSAEWKLAVAVCLKERTSVRNAWLSERLNMGVARGVSSTCGRYSKRKTKCPIYRKLQKVDI